MIQRQSCFRNHQGVWRVLPVSYLCFYVTELLRNSFAKCETAAGPTELLQLGAELKSQG